MNMKSRRVSSHALRCGMPEQVKHELQQSDTTITQTAEQSSIRKLKEYEVYNRLRSTASVSRGGSGQQVRGDYEMQTEQT